MALIKKDASADVAATSVEDGKEMANIPAATEFAPSGAPMQTVPDVDPTNMAVDENPRANTTVVQNKIDWNDPRPEMGHEAVARALNEQGVPTSTNPAPAKDEQDGTKSKSGSMADAE